MLGRGGILLCPRGFPAVTVRLKLRDGAAKSPCTCGLDSEIYIEVERREQERIEKDRQDLFNRLEQEHLRKLKKLEEQHRSKKQSLGKQHSQIEGLQKEKEARLTKLTFLQFLEKRTLAAELMDLDKQKRELLALIQTAESDYVTMRDQEHMNFNLLLVEKGL